MKIIFLKALCFGAIAALVNTFLVLVVKYRSGDYSDVPNFIHLGIGLLLALFLIWTLLALAFCGLCAWFNWRNRKKEDWLDVHQPGWRGRNT